MTNIVFLNTETTGLHPGRLVWEIAMIRRGPNGKESAPKVIQVADVDLSDADPFALKINGFYDRYHLYADPPKDTWIYNEYNTASIVESFTRECHIVGAVPNFDTETLEAMLRRNKLRPNWHYHLIDVENLAVGYLRGHRAAAINSGEDLHDSNEYNLTLPWKSDELSRAIGVKPPLDEERHTALGDVKWAMRIYDKVMGIS